MIKKLAKSVREYKKEAILSGVFITIEEPFCVVLLVITGGIDAFIRIVPRPVG